MTKKDILFGAIIGEAVAWLLILTAEGIQVPIFYLDIAKKFLPVALPILCIVGLYIALWLSRYLSSMFEIAKFGLVGILNTFVDLGVLNLFIIFFNQTSGLYYSIFKGASFVAAVINSYFWNKFWTFHTQKPSTPVQSGRREFLQFLGVSAGGLIINIAIARIFTDLINPFGSLTDRQWATAAAVFATLAGLVWNFLGYKFFVFKTKNQPSSPTQ